MVWYSHLFQNFLQFTVIHTVKGFSTVNEAEVDVFLELPCFLHDLMNISILETHLVHLEVFGSHTAEAWLEGFYAQSC